MANNINSTNTKRLQSNENVPAVGINGNGVTYVKDALSSLQASTTRSKSGATSVANTKRRGALAEKTFNSTNITNNNTNNGPIA
ncbi:hypothetical protein BX616_003107, partial [Lobosporangium transversale]